jgi:hypothetical protein
MCASKPLARHHGEMLSLDCADVGPAQATPERDLETGGQIVGQAQVRGEQIPGTGGQDRHGRVGAD